MTRRTSARIAAAATAAALLFGAQVHGSSPALGSGDDGREHAPPPPIRDNVPSAAPEVAEGGLRAATTQYSHGDPTDDEQWFLELMNRARANPAAEADRILVDYDSNRIQQSVSFFLGQRPGVEPSRRENHDAFDALPAAAPFAFSAQISAAARGHTAVMKQTDQQTHQAPGEPALRDRVDAQGYGWVRLGESIYCFADSMLHAHAGFAIDWGQPIDGDTGLPAHGHRDSLMEPAFVEVGIGVLYDDSGATNVGPELITIDFAQPADDSLRYVTGVAFGDDNGNGMYDPGEGISGLRIETDVSDFYALTSASGGYALPVPKNAGQTVVSATATPGTDSEGLDPQQTIVTVAGANVKVDFGPPPEPAPPEFATLAGGTNVPIGDGDTVDAFVAVGELDPDSATIGDVDLTLAIDHADRSELTVTLIGPTGVSATLLLGGPAGPDVRGTFDTTLRPRASLGAFVGTPYQGTWTLRIEDAAGGVTSSMLESWALHVRPEWVRPLFAERSPLVVKTLKIKNSPKAGKDSVLLKGTFDAGGVALDPTLGGTLRLLHTATSAAYLEVDLPAAVVTKRGDGKFATPDGASVKSKFKFDPVKSRGTFVIKVKGLDLFGFPSPDVRVELAAGGALLTQDVNVSDGKSTGTASPLFVVDKVVSKPSASGRTTTVAGRFAGGDGAIGTVTGAVELSVGTARIRMDAADLTPKGSKLVFKSGSGLRKLTVDTLKGTFSLKLDGVHEVQVDGLVPVSLRLGDAFFGETAVLPAQKGTKTLY